MRTKIWDSRYPNGRIGDFQNKVVGPPLESYTLRYGAGLIRPGDWELKEVINNGTPTVVLASGSTPAGPALANGEDPNRPNPVVMSPKQDFAPDDGATNYVVYAPEGPIARLMSPTGTETALGKPSGEGLLALGSQSSTVYAGVEIRDAESNHLYTTAKSPTTPGQPYTPVPLYNVPQIPPGSVVIAKPFIEIESTLTDLMAGTPSLESDDRRLAFSGFDDGQFLENLGMGWQAPSTRQLGQDVSIPSNGNRRYFGGGKLYPQLVIPPDAAARQLSPLTLSGRLR